MTRKNKDRHLQSHDSLTDQIINWTTPILSGAGFIVAYFDGHSKGILAMVAVASLLFQIWWHYRDK